MVEEILQNIEILTVIGTIFIGIIIRFVYDFWVKPFFKKKKSQLSHKQLKQLVKNSLESIDDFHLLLDYLSSCENTVLKSYHPRLKHFDKKCFFKDHDEDLSEKELQELETFEEILKDLKKHCK